jgi:nitronate monooxygenase
VIAAARAGSFGFVPAGYKSPDEFAAQLATVRAAGVPFGVNLFAPNPIRVDPGAFRQYAAAIQREADLFDIDLTGARIVEDDDHWQAKLDLLIENPVPVVSFTFGIPDGAVISALRSAGSVLLQTVTTPEEARDAEAAGMDVVLLQASAAGGHSGTLHPSRPTVQVALPDLVREVASAVSLPVIAAGGVSISTEGVAALDAGAIAVAVGTALLLADEAGTSATHRAALQDASRTTTVITRAFTGRPARALENDFTRRYSTVAPIGYPALHHLTRPIRQAAAASGDPERLHLWAGTGWRHAEVRTAAGILTSLAGTV